MAIDFQTGGFVIGYHTALAVLLPYYLSIRTPSFGLLLSTFIVLVLCSLSITLGYHRFYAHKTFKLRKGAEAIVLFLGTLAVENKVLAWCFDHRRHHKFVDTDKDPYNIKKGFFHAHMLWLFKQRKEFVLDEVKDLVDNRLVFFQYKYYIPLMLACNILVVGGLGLLFGDLLGAFVFVFLLRLFLTHHITWLINSWAHSFGNQPFSKEHTAVNNWLLAFFTFGEGYHNFHHTFASDYRNGVRWYHYDPTKYTIWMLDKLGLAYDLKKISSARIKKAVLQEDKREILSRLRDYNPEYYDQVEARVTELYQQLYEHVHHLYETREQYKMMKKSKAAQEQILTFKQRYLSLKKEYNDYLKQWADLRRQAQKNPAALAA